MRGVLHYFGALAVSLTSTFLHVACDNPDLNFFENLIPSGDRYVLRKHKNFIICYDGRTRGPVYVVERLQQSHEYEKQFKRPNFYVESVIDADFMPSLEDYKNSGYDKGHLAPAADFKGTHKEYKATFSLANISPQHPVVNRGIWKALEKWTRDLLNTCDVVVVISGPAYIPTQISENGPPQLIVETIGHSPKLIHVPTHFFKVILTQKRLSTGTIAVSCAAFVVPNLDPSDYLPPGFLLSPKSFLVKIRDLEAIVGLRFFSDLPDFSVILDESIQEEGVHIIAERGHVIKHQDKTLSSRTNFLFSEVSLPRMLHLDVIPTRNSTLLDSIDVDDRTHIVKYPNRVFQFYHLCSTNQSVDCKKELGRVAQRGSN